MLGALTSIAASARKLDQYEKKFNERRLITVGEAIPEMARKTTKAAKRNLALKRQASRRRNGATTTATQMPVSMGGISRIGTPQVASHARGLTITHSENVSTLPLNALGALNYFTLQLIPTLPYLKGVAQNFGKWKWLKLRIRYVPACPATTEGECAMGLYFDRQDAIAATFLQVSSMHKAISFPPWGGFSNNGASTVTIDVDCTEFDKNRYSYMTSANFAALSASDENNYCPVSLALATQGSTTAVPVGGRIWFDYTIQLTDPIVPAINI